MCALERDANLQMQFATLNKNLITVLKTMLTASCALLYLMEVPWCGKDVIT